MPPRILLVDTHPLNRLVVAEQLTTLGHAPMCADDGDEALALFDVGTFDLVLTECRMQGMDGFALTARIRSLAIARGIEACPIVGYSADAALDAPLAAQCGMHACLPMPIPLQVLDTLLQSSLPAQARARPRARDCAQWALFAATSREDLHAARACLGSGDVLRLRNLFHRIKGAALMIGENDLAATCARGEAGCDEWGPIALQDTIALAEAQLDIAQARVDDPQWEPSR